ncbi:MAG TPA: ABC transporter permease [Vicinamibacterales bacterium]|nr:ABC transporter permease [Vicinamibacterales bacterium]
MLQSGDMTFNELRYALRTLKNTPSFAAIAVLTLALGVGANTAMFSVVNGVLLRPLDYPNAARIVQLNTSQKGRSFPRLTGPDFVDIRDDASALEQVSYYFGGEMGVQMADHAEFAGTYLVTPNFFSVFGVAPAFGRAFDTDDAQRGAVVGLPFAARNFGSGAAALGQTLRMEGVAYAIVGVVPPSFSFPREAQVWLATSPRPSSMERTAYNYRAVALVRSDSSIDAANAQLRTIGAQLEAAFPVANKDKRFLAVPLQEQLVGPVRATLYFLMGAVSLVLLIACANVANLLLARATARQREMAVRAALGASRAALARQLLVESGVIAIAGGALGLLMALAGTRALTHVTAQQVGLPRLDDIRINWMVFAFAIGVSLAASFLFGLSPAWQAAKTDLNDALRQAGRGLAGSSGRVRNALVVVQVALSFALAIGAGLLFRSFLTLTSVDLGFRTQGILVMYAHDPAHTLDDYLQAGRFFADAVEQVKQIPGVMSAGAAMGVPTGQYGSNGAYVVDGRDWTQRGTNSPQATFSLSGPGYFSTMSIPLVRGRDFNAGDAYDRQFVAIISESLARQSFPGQDPIGHTIMCGLDSLKWMTVVGVVADTRQDSPASAMGPALYMPLLQHPYHANEIQVVMRTAVSPTSLIDPVRTKMRSLGPETATKFTTLEAMVSSSIATPRLRMMLVGLFAGLALLLAMAGMYGVMTYVTIERIPEFGVRMALGASPRSVLALVLGRAAQMAAIGVAIGVALAFSAARVLNTMLFGLKATDAITYAGVLLAVTPIVVLAAAIPAWRASRADPVVALRSE